MNDKIASILKLSPAEFATQEFYFLHRAKNALWWYGIGFSITAVTFGQVIGKVETALQDNREKVLEACESIYTNFANANMNPQAMANLSPQVQQQIRAMNQTGQSKIPDWLLEPFRRVLKHKNETVTFGRAVISEFMHLIGLRRDHLGLDLAKSFLARFLRSLMLILSMNGLDLLTRPLLQQYLSPDFSYSVASLGSRECATGGVSLHSLCEFSGHVGHYFFSWFCPNTWLDLSQAPCLKVSRDNFGTVASSLYGKGTTLTDVIVSRCCWETTNYLLLQFFCWNNIARLADPRETTAERKKVIRKATAASWYFLKRVCIGAICTVVCNKVLKFTPYGSSIVGFNLLAGFIVGSPPVAEYFDF